VPAWTFTATAEVVRYLGGVPVLVDVDPDTLCMDLADADRKVTARTRGVVPVHFAGLPVDRGGLEDLAAQHDLRVVEDAAHALPTMSSGRLVGQGSSEAVVFSFYATKTITTGEGGMVVTADPALAQRIRTMRLHGINRDVFDRYTSTKPSWHYEVVAPGFKYNLTDPAAAMGRVQLGRAREMRDRRAAIADRYDAAFAGLGVRLPAREPAGSEHAWHLYVLRLDGVVPRDEFVEEMARRGVGCSVHFIPLHLHPYWRDFCEVTASDLPVATEQFRTCVSLPAFSGMTSEQVDRVVEAVRDVLGAP
jgi:dTDP-4-amino-4,6-dideoxygalactose transaminase